MRDGFLAAAAMYNININIEPQKKSCLRPRPRMESELVL